MRSLTSKTTKLLATVTAAGALTLGGASVAYAADGAAPASDPAAPAAGARAHRPHVLRNAIKAAFAASAETLGMTTQELRVAVKDGPQSIASVAGDQTGAVTAAIVAALHQRLDEAVANGTITAERADRARSRIPQAADRFVHRVPGPRAA